MALLYRIVTTEEWKAFGESGTFSGSMHDLRDGFIHLSAAQQVAATLAAHYPGKTGLWLLSIRRDLLEGGSEGKLVWEPSRGGEHFPHFYGTLRIDAVVSFAALGLDGNGRHVLPSLEMP